VIVSRPGVYDPSSSVGFGDPLGKDLIKQHLARRCAGSGSKQRAAMAGDVGTI
jgi:hypothetical protein